VVALANFSSEYNVMAMIIVVYMLSIIIMMIISGEIGKRTQKVSETV
jgi:BASS family bile acid:Na+ symporter